jgi:MoxR-like ATPase
LLEALRTRFGIVGRTRELEDLLATVRSHRHALLEGPVGVGKTALARAVAEGLDRPWFRVDGDGRYSESKLVGQFDPPVVLERGYVAEAFRAGPLVRAMESGGVLFVNELNRMPEGVQNVLLPAMDEGQVEVPMLGTVRAKEGFVVVATQNPAEFVATSHLAEALLDRFELVVVDYPPEDEEREIVRRRARVPVPDDVVARAVSIVRATRSHPHIQRGASIRAGIAVGELTVALGDFDRAVALALPTRIELVDERDTPIAQVLEELKKKAQVPSRP